MSVLLNWSSTNAALASSINVYRSTAPLNMASLPTALTTLAGNVTTYTDTSAVANTTYYYALGMVRSGQELVSPQIIVGHYANTGPGPSTLLRGDWSLGYFGIVPVASMLTPSQLNTQVPFPGTRTADANVTGWYKFVRKGKIIFIPNYVFATAGSFVAYYNAGLVFGTNDNGAFPFTPSATTINGYTGAVNQYKVATVSSYSFIVRCLRMAASAPTSSYITLGVDTIGSEWWDLICRLGQTSLSSSPTDKWNDLTAAATLNSSITPYFSASSALVNVGGTNWDSYASTGIANGQGPTFSWLPVLELILT